MASACMPLTDVTGKSLEDINPALFGCVGEKWVQSVVGPAEVFPVSPISQADFLSLIQDPIGGVSPRSNVKTSKATLLCRRSISQEFPCGRGKSELNLARKAWSVRL